MDVLGRLTARGRSPHQAGRQGMWPQQGEPGAGEMGAGVWHSFSDQAPEVQPHAMAEFLIVTPYPTLFPGPLDFPDTPPEHFFVCSFGSLPSHPLHTVSHSPGSPASCSALGTGLTSCCQCSRKGSGSC